VAHRTFDAIVVGSGCAGGWAAKELTEAGFSTLVLEAGPDVRREDVPAQTAVPPEVFVAAGGAQSVQARHPKFSSANAKLFVDDREHPYTTPDGKPFVWIRGRQVGGRSLTWGRVCLRMSDHEFTAAGHDGVGIDWPIGHDDLAAAYARVEEFHDVRGARDGVAQLPDGVVRSPTVLTPAERRFKQAVEARWPDRHVIAQRGIDEPTPTDAWPTYTSQGSTLAAAAATGHLVLRSDVVVTHVLSSGAASARGVRIVDRQSLVAEEIEARVVILCPSTIETARILMNSATSAHPNGLGNSSGCLGRYLTDRPHAKLSGRLDESLRSADPFRVNGPHGIFTPRFRNIGDDRQSYRRSFGLWGALGRGDKPDDFLFIVQGEMLPHDSNRVTLDPNRCDRWGVPLAHIDCEWHDNDRALIEAGVADALEMITEAGIHVDDVGGMDEPGRFIHELGTARMGSGPMTSFLNGSNQSWDVKNLFVADGSCFSSAGYQNPTLTMTALASRCGQIVAAELAAGRL
jgi:choline dehydrogenase-like flavoprotein